MGCVTDLFRRAVVSRAIAISNVTNFGMAACSSVKGGRSFHEITLDSPAIRAQRVTVRAWAFEAQLESGLARVYDLIGAFQHGFGYLESERLRGAFVEGERVSACFVAY
jgi:hypothetical protein